MNFGELLSELRKDRGLLQKDLAEVLGVSVSTVSNYETGAHYPDIDGILRISDYFDVSTDYLFGRTTLRQSLAAYNHRLPSGISLGELINIISGFEEEDLVRVEEYVKLLKMKTG